MTTIPTPEECHKDACIDSDQQFSRILRRWIALPFGQSNERSSNHDGVRLAIEYLMFGRIIDRSLDPTLHGYWSDGIELVEWTTSSLSYFLGGACYLSDRDGQSQWLVPFELRIGYDEQNIDCPHSVDLRFGHRDLNERVSKRYPACQQYRLYAMAHCLYGDRPKVIDDWAAHIYLCPYAPK